MPWQHTRRIYLHQKRNEFRSTTESLHLMDPILGAGRFHQIDPMLKDGIHMENRSSNVNWGMKVLEKVKSLDCQNLLIIHAALFTLPSVFTSGVRREMWDVRRESADIDCVLKPAWLRWKWTKASVRPVHNIGTYTYCLWLLIIANCRFQTPW